METDTAKNLTTIMRGGLFLAACILFFLSGVSSLAYEVAWVKVLTHQFGSSAWSVSTVVASFMAGLGAGIAWSGRLSDRIRRPIKGYALLELGIVIFGIISAPLLESMGGIIGSLLAGFVFLPWLGASGSIRLAAVLGYLLAMVLFYSNRHKSWRPGSALYSPRSSTVMSARPSTQMGDFASGFNATKSPTGRSKSCCTLWPRSFPMWRSSISEATSSVLPRMNLS